MTTLFPPVLESQGIAQSATSGSLEIPFNLPSSINYDQIGHLQVVIKYKNNGAYAVTQKASPDGSTVYVSKSKGNYFKYTPADRSCKLSLPRSIFQGGGPQVATTYYLQVRFGSDTLWDGGEAEIGDQTFTNFNAWRRKQTSSIPSGFGEWSNLQSVYFYGESNITFQETEFDIDGLPVSYIRGVHFTYEPKDDIHDTISQCKITYAYQPLLKDKKIVKTLVYTNNISEGGAYDLQVEIPVAPISTIAVAIEAVTVNNHLIGDIPAIYINSPMLESKGLEFEDWKLYGEENGDGVIAKRLNLLETSVSEDQIISFYRINLYNFEIMRIKKITSPSSGSIFSFKDFTVEMGEEYQYIAILSNTKTFETFELVPVFPFGYNNSGYGRLMRMESVFLADKHHQLRISGNVNISSLKKNTSDSFQTTIGSVYPYYSRSSQIGYQTLSLSGVVSINFDPTSSFFRQDNDSWLTGKEGLWWDTDDGSNPVILNRDLYQELEFSRSRTRMINSNQSAIQELDDQSYFFDNNNSLSVYDDYLYKDVKSLVAPEVNDNMIYMERKFRQYVMDWLSNGQPKLFRSETEGNMIIIASGVSFSPLANTARSVYTVSMTITEIAKCDLEGLADYQLQPISLETKVLSLMPRELKVGNIISEEIYLTLIAKENKLKDAGYFKKNDGKVNSYLVKKSDKFLQEVLDFFTEYDFTRGRQQFLSKGWYFQKTSDMDIGEFIKLPAGQVKIIDLSVGLIYDGSLTPNWTSSGLPNGITIDSTTGVLTINSNFSTTKAETLNINLNFSDTATETIEINIGPTYKELTLKEKEVSGVSEEFPTLTISGGKTPYTLQAIGLPKGKTAKINNKNEVEITGNISTNIPGGKYQIIVTDALNQQKSLSFDYSSKIMTFDYAEGYNSDTVIDLGNFYEGDYIGGSEKGIDLNQYFINPSKDEALTFTIDKTIFGFTISNGWLKGVLSESKPKDGKDSFTITASHPEIPKETLTLTIDFKFERIERLRSKLLEPTPSRSSTDIYYIGFGWKTKEEDFKGYLFVGDKIAVSNEQKKGIIPAACLDVIGGIPFRDDKNNPYYEYKIFPSTIGFSINQQGYIIGDILSSYSIPQPCIIGIYDAMGKMVRYPNPDYEIGIRIPIIKDLLKYQKVPKTTKQNIELPYGITNTAYNYRRELLADGTETDELPRLQFLKFTANYEIKDDYSNLCYYFLEDKSSKYSPWPKGGGEAIWSFEPKIEETEIVKMISLVSSNNGEDKSRDKITCALVFSLTAAVDENDQEISKGKTIAMESLPRDAVIVPITLGPVYEKLTTVTPSTSTFFLTSDLASISSSDSISMEKMILVAKRIKSDEETTIYKLPEVTGGKPPFTLEAIKYTPEGGIFSLDENALAPLKIFQRESAEQEPNNFTLRGTGVPNLENIGLLLQDSLGQRQYFYFQDTSVPIILEEPSYEFINSVPNLGFVEGAKVTLNLALLKITKPSFISTSNNYSIRVVLRQDNDFFKKVIPFCIISEKQLGTTNEYIYYLKNNPDAIAGTTNIVEGDLPSVNCADGLSIQIIYTQDGAEEVVAEYRTNKNHGNWYSPSIVKKVIGLPNSSSSTSTLEIEELPVGGLLENKAKYLFGNILNTEDYLKYAFGFEFENDAGSVDPKEHNEIISKGQRTGIYWLEEIYALATEFKKEGESGKDIVFGLKQFDSFKMNITATTTVAEQTQTKLIFVGGTTFEIESTIIEEPLKEPITIIFNGTKPMLAWVGEKSEKVVKSLSKTIKVDPVGGSDKIEEINLLAVVLGDDTYSPNLQDNIAWESSDSKEWTIDGNSLKHKISATDKESFIDVTGSVKNYGEITLRIHYLGAVSSIDIAKIIKEKPYFSDIPPQIANGYALNFPDEASNVNITGGTGKYGWALFEIKENTYVSLTPYNYLFTSAGFLSKEINDVSTGNSAIAERTGYIVIWDSGFYGNSPLTKDNKVADWAQKFEINVGAITLPLQREKTPRLTNDYIISPGGITLSNYFTGGSGSYTFSYEPVPESLNGWKITGVTESGGELTIYVDKPEKSLPETTFQSFITIKDKKTEETISLDLIIEKYIVKPSNFEYTPKDLVYFDGDLSTWYSIGQFSGIPEGFSLGISHNESAAQRFIEDEGLTYFPPWARERWSANNFNIGEIRNGEAALKVNPPDKQVSSGNAAESNPKGKSKSNNFVRLVVYLYDIKTGFISANYEILFSLAISSFNGNDKDVYYVKDVQQQIVAIPLYFGEYKITRKGG